MGVDKNLYRGALCMVLAGGRRMKKKMLPFTWGFVGATPFWTCYVLVTCKSHCSLPSRSSNRISNGAQHKRVITANATDSNSATPMRDIHAIRGKHLWHRIAQTRIAASGNLGCSCRPSFETRVASQPVALVTLAARI